MREYLEIRKSYLKRIIADNKAMLKRHFTKSLELYIFACQDELNMTIQALEVCK